MTFSCQRRGTKQDLPGRLSSDIRIHKLDKIVSGGEGKEKYPVRVKCVLHKRSEVKLETFVNSAFRFTKNLVLRNTIQ
jgi:hypothetical protein